MDPKVLIDAYNMFSSAAPILAVGAGAAKKAFKKSSKRATRPPKQPSSVYKPHGDASGKKRIAAARKKTRKRKPKTVKQEVRAIKKRLGRLPPNTVDTVKGMRPMTLTSPVNFKTVYFIKCRLDDSSYDVNAASVSGVDLTDSECRLRILNRFARYDFLNFGNNNCSLKYAFYKCVDDSDDSYLTNMKEEAAVVGATITDTVNTRATASSTVNEIPEYIEIGMTLPESHAQVFHVDPQTWKQVGAQQRVTLGPGDTISVAESFGDYLFSPFKRNNDPRQYHNNDLYLLLEVTGAVAKMPVTDPTAPNLIGYSGADLYATAFESFKMVINDGEGRKILTASNDIVGTNFDTTAQVITNEDPTLETVI